MKLVLKNSLLFLCLFSYVSSYGWGHNGHRIVGEIASKHVSIKTKRKLKKIMGDYSLAEASTWADEVRSNPKYNFFAPSHYTSVKDGADYQQERDNDILATLKKLFISIKKDKKFLDFTNRQKIALVVHLVGDLHQPLHVGRADDWGGNRIRVNWFGKTSNLHKVWDSGVIEKTGLSYTELVDFLNRKEKTNRYKDTDLNQASAIELINRAAKESIALRAVAYNFKKGYSTDFKTLDSLDELFKNYPHADNLKYKKQANPDKYPDLSYDYLFRARPVVERRLLQAGLRLAKILNQIL